MSAKRRIDKLTIKGFQSIKSLEDFQLTDLNILIGANGAGKSNFVTYFRMLLEMVEGNLGTWVEKRGGADRILSYGVKETQQLESTIFFGTNGYNFVLEPTNDGKFVFIEEKVFFSGSFAPAHWRIIGSGDKESILKKKADQDRNAYKSDIERYCYEAISNWKVFHFHDTSDTAGVKWPVNLPDNAILREDARNLAAFLYKLREQYRQVYEQIRKIIQLAIPFFDDFVLNPEILSTGLEQIRLLWVQKNSDYPLWPSQLSDGSIRFICLVTALLQPYPPSTIIIDEPELGLHPYAITLLGALLRSESQRMQVIVSTQSVPLLNEFDIDNLIVVEREQGGSTFKRLNKDEFESWLEEYSVGELWEKNVLGGRPRS